MIAPAAAALATAAVIAGVLVATVPAPHDGVAPAAEPVAALPYPAAAGPVDTTFRFTAHLLGTEPTVRTFSVDRDGQRLEFRTPESAQQCSLASAAEQVTGDCGRVSMVTLLYGGRPTSSDVRAFDPGQLTGRTRQDVDGRRGYFGTRRAAGATPGLMKGLHSVHLYWQYAQGAWADALAPTRAQALALAQSVRPAQKRLTVPVELKPGSGEYLGAIESEASAKGGSYEIVSEAGTATVTWGAGRYVKVGSIDLTGEKVAGRTWLLGHFGGRAEAQLKDSAMPIAVSVPDGTSTTQVRTYLGRVRVAADPAQLDTWFAASELRSGN